MTDDEIHRILQDRVDLAKRSVGIVAGLVDDKGARIVSYGKPNQESDQTVDGDTVFEIGSVTKAFTAILLADMAGRSEVKLNDPISKYLPTRVKTPVRGGKEITLLHLSTHTSGLPRMPENFASKDDQNPYADYSVEQMYAFLSGYTLPRDIGATYEYSNYGAGLLGHILALRAGMDYETLVRTRIAQPLKMDSTSIKLTPSMQARLATGHTNVRRPAANWDIPALAGSGALRSTANDMLKFVAANLVVRPNSNEGLKGVKQPATGLIHTFQLSSVGPLGLSQSPQSPLSPLSELSAAMQMTHQPQHGAGAPEMEIGLGWHILKKFGAEIVWHNGGTGGYHAFAGFEKKHKGVVVLSNSIGDIDDIGRHLIESQFPLSGN